MLYPQEIIDQVIDSNNIVDVISQYVKLTKRGSTYFGLCPFHSEKTPSFSVTDNGSKKMFYCFGCHTGGSVITFLMKYENYSYTEAIRDLAQRAGIELPKPDYSQKEAERYRKREQIMEVYKHAAVFYVHLLRSPKGSHALQYLKDRQLSDETIRRFGLGYASSNSSLYQYLRSKGYTDEVLKATELFSMKEKGVYDYFWNRVMFPIMDSRSRVIAFGGRVMGDGEPKYLNSRETAVFEKRKTLFGIHIAAKHKGDEWILCEGYMDVISLHQAGFSNAVASLGTALTGEHAAALKRYTSRVVLSYDSDSAGRHAASRAIPILRGAGLKVKVINLLPYKDPDELIKAEGTQAYAQRLREARNSLLFEIDMIREKYDLEDPDGRTGFYQETARRLSYLDDEIERDNYLQTVCREYNIDYRMLKDRTVRLALNREPDNPYEVVMNQEPEPRRPANREEQKGLVESMRVLLSWLADHPSMFPAVENVLSREDFCIEPYDAVASLLFDQIRRGQVNIAGIIGSFASEEEQELVAGMFSSGLDQEEEKVRLQLLNDCVIRIRSHAIEKKMAETEDISLVLKLRKEKEETAGMRVFG